MKLTEFEQKAVDFVRAAKQAVHCVFPEWNYDAVDDALERVDNVSVPKTTILIWLD